MRVGAIYLVGGYFLRGWRDLRFLTVSFYVFVGLG